MHRADNPNLHEFSFPRETRTRTSENLLRVEFEAQDRKSARYRRKMDREISSARQELAEIEARTPSPRRASASSQAQEKFSVTPEPDCSDLLAMKTKRNLALSHKLANSLEVKRQQRESSPNSPCYGHQPVVSVSPRAVQELQKAATVLKNTPHEAEVLKLLTTVQPASPSVSPRGNSRSPRNPRS